VSNGEITPELSTVRAIQRSDLLVFLITNTVTQQTYVGITASCMDSRWQQFIDALHLGIDAPLYTDILEYGQENFTLMEWGETDDFMELKEIKQDVISSEQAIDLQGMRTSRPRIQASTVSDTTTAIMKSRNAIEAANALGKASANKTVAITASTQPAKVARKANPKPKVASGRASSSTKERAIREAIAKEKAERTAKKEQQTAAEADEMSAIMARLDARGSKHNRR
jgi:hypothetical protein